jgi:folate-dependent phosphoribosylglycinamide formyltransferase PurN
VQEHQIYPRAVRWLVEGALTVSSTGLVTLKGDGEGDVAQASFGA